MRKKLIEVALPLEAINAESSRRKRKAPSGYPTTLHKWWAQRPIAACRAVLFASLVDDPSSDPMFSGDEDIEASKRAELFNLIEELVLWENSNNPRVFNKARAEIARCIASRKIESGELKKDQAIRLSEEGGNKAAKTYTPQDITRMLAPSPAVNHFLATYGPPVLDPFCGGGSIPLEAQRLGLRTYGSDLNPVAVLITKALIEIPPKFAAIPPVNPEWRNKSREQRATTVWQRTEGLAEDVRYYGRWVRDEAEKQIGHLFPNAKITKDLAKDRPELKEHVGKELPVIAWLWARTIECPNPACRGQMPLVRSFWLSKRKGRNYFALPVVDKKRKRVSFDVATSGQPPKHTTDRTGARCIFCDQFIKKPQLRDMATATGIRVIPLAVAVDGAHGRLHLPASVVQPPDAPTSAMPFLEQPITDDRRWFSPPLYGLRNYIDLFTSRQLVSLATMSDLIDRVRDQVRAAAEVSSEDWWYAEAGSCAGAYADAVAVYLAMALSRAVDYNSAFASWRSKDNAMRSTLAKQALPMVWDFAEANIFQKSSAGYSDCVEVVAKCVELLPASSHASVDQLDATSAVSKHGGVVVCTDPPYYDNIGYADLSDFFYLWLRRSLSRVTPSLFATVVTPKTQELIASSQRHEGSREKAQAFFEEGLGKAFTKMRGMQDLEYPLTVYYAFKCFGSAQR
jgi:putative DNA methylase